jgi:hypothetical protein
VRKRNREPARFRSTVDSNGRTIWIADAHRDGSNVELDGHGDIIATS